MEKSCCAEIKGYHHKICQSWAPNIEHHFTGNLNKKYPEAHKGKLLLCWRSVVEPSTGKHVCGISIWTILSTLHRQSRYANPKTLEKLFLFSLRAIHINVIYFYIFLYRPFLFTELIPFFLNLNCLNKELSKIKIVD